MFIGLLLFPIGYLIGFPFGAGADIGLIFFAMPVVSAAFFPPKVGKFGKLV
jgi:hypothetical protein